MLVPNPNQEVKYDDGDEQHEELLDSTMKVLVTVNRRGHSSREELLPKFLALCVNEIWTSCSRSASDKFQSLLAFRMKLS